MGRAFVLSLGEITLLGAALLSLGYFAGNSKAKFRSSSSSTTALSKGERSGSNNRFRTTSICPRICTDVLANEGPLLKQTSATSNSSTTETTLSYKVAISDKNPLMVHRSGREFLKFREQLKAMQEEGGVVIEGESYVETELGYV
eukprot:scaffold12220_cov204-Skeletonema_marinoi.AAC.2